MKTSNRNAANNYYRSIGERIGKLRRSLSADHFRRKYPILSDTFRKYRRVSVSSFKAREAAFSCLYLICIDRLKVGYHESSTCSRDTYPQSHISSSLLVYEGKNSCPYGIPYFGGLWICLCGCITKSLVAKCGVYIKVRNLRTTA